jgi:uncharacterized delta-60 repeat protein
VVRYTASGGLDTSFGMGGMVTTTTMTGAQAQAVALQPNGKIVVSGRLGSNDNGLVLVCYNADGSLDTAFNGTGIATTTALTTGHSVAVQPADGKLVVAGTASDGIGFGLARYLGDTSAPLLATLAKGSQPLTAHGGLSTTAANPTAPSAVAPSRDLPRPSLPTAWARWNQARRPPEGMLRRPLWTSGLTAWSQPDSFEPGP